MQSSIFSSTHLRAYRLIDNRAAHSTSICAWHGCHGMHGRRKRIYFKTSKVTTPLKLPSRQRENLLSEGCCAAVRSILSCKNFKLSANDVSLEKRSGVSGSGAAAKPEQKITRFCYPQILHSQLLALFAEQTAACNHQGCSCCLTR